MFLFPQKYDLYSVTYEVGICLMSPSIMIFIMISFSLINLPQTQLQWEINEHM